MTNKELNKEQKCHLEELLEKLPEKSKGRTADNQEILWAFHYSWVHRDNPAWPILALCEDMDRKSYTWHIGCDDYPISRWVEKWSRGRLEIVVSSMRKRNLKFREIYTRKGDSYSLSEDEET